MGSKLPQINARITKEQNAIIEILMQELGLSKAELIRTALADLATKHKKDSTPFHETPQHGGKRG